MYVQDFLPPKGEVIQRALASPKVKPGSELEVAMRAVGDTVAALAKDKIEYEVHIDLSDAVAMYEVVNGGWAALNDDHARDEYSSGLDDAVETALEKYNDHLSADWLGRCTIDTRLWEDGACAALAKSAAKEVWKQLTHDKTPTQVLASAGIVTADVEAAMQPENKGVTDMTDTIDAVVQKIKKHVGKGFDQVAVYDDLEMVCEEDDEILANAAASRLGISAADIQVIQIAALDMDDAPSELVERVQAEKVESKTAATKRERAAVQAEKTENAVDASVLEALKECGASDTTMAEMLGVSRSTFINYVKGKTPFVPDADAYSTVREELVKRANLLLTALGTLDGTEPEFVA